MGEEMPVVVFAPLIGLAACVVTHCVAARLSSLRSPYPCLALGAVAGMTASVASTWIACSRATVAPGDTTALVAMNLLASAAFAFNYFCFVNLAITSLRIRLLGELSHAGGCLSKTALLARYDTSDVIALRIQRLVKSGHIVERNGRFFTGHLHFLAVARIFDYMRWLIVGARHPASRGTAPHRRATDVPLGQ